MRISRRGILVGAAAGGGLLVAWGLWPRRFENPLPPSAEEVAFGVWIKIAADGVVSVAVPQLEMGQGITTLLPQIVAQELGADWRQVAVEPAPVSGAYANLPLAARWAPLWAPLWSSLAQVKDDLAEDDLLVRRWAQDTRFTATAKGTSLAAFEQPCREAAASARAVLAMAAARRWGVDWQECEAQDGFITHSAGGDRAAGRRASFADLVLESAALDPPSPPPLRSAPASDAAPGEDLADPLAPALSPAAGFALAPPFSRTRFARLDLPSKVDGSHIFACDVRLPGMAFAAIRHGPLDEAELLDFDPAPAAGQRGLLAIVRGKGWLAAVAQTWWAAEQALERIGPRFAASRPVDSAAIAARLAAEVGSAPGSLIASRGAGLAGYQPDFARKYEAAPALHATIETTCATARFADGILELWLPAQAPELARAAAARGLGISAANVVLYPVSAGGSFDRRLEQQVAIEAALIAREAGRPVQITWSRAEEHRAAYPRMPAAGLLSAALGNDGTIRALRARLAAPPTMLEFGRRLFGNRTSPAAISEAAGKADPMAVEGLWPPYAIADVGIEHVSVSLDLPTAPMRGGADAITCFMRESFIDEIAHAHAREPLSYRMAMLGGDPRLAHCLQQAARMAAWDGGVAGSGQGLACHVMGENLQAARIALVASVRAAGGTAGGGGLPGGLRVVRIDACVDIGRVVNRDIALQQVEGGLIFALGLALGEASDYVDGLPTLTRLAGLGLPALAECPRIAVQFVPSDSPPVDPGEIGVPALAPAIANAVFSAMGLRLRRLPLLAPVA